MNCLKCNDKLEKIAPGGKNKYGFYQFYKCPNCENLYLCTSQSEDMVQENLRLLDSFDEDLDLLDE